MTCNIAKCTVGSEHFWHLTVYDMKRVKGTTFSGRVSSTIRRWKPLCTVAEGLQGLVLPYHSAGAVSTAFIGVQARGLRGTAGPPTWAKPLFFGQMLNFWGRSLQPKVKNILLYFVNEKNGFIPSSEIKCPKSAIFTNRP